MTLFGVVDATLNRTTADNIGSVTQLTHSGYNSSRIGFRGVEDLGGGLSAGFWLEAGIANDSGLGGANNTNNQASGASNNGGLNFNRRATVSLSGGFGEIRLGRDYVPAFWNQTVFDPFGTNGVGAVSNLTQRLGTIDSVATTTRASNSIGYFLPANLGGIYGQAMYALGENNSTAANSDDGTHAGFRIGYQSGPLNVALGYGVTRLETTAVNGDFTNINIGASYDFTSFKLMGQWTQEKDEFVGFHKNSVYMIGASVPVGSGEIRASLARGQSDSNPAGKYLKGNQFALGYVHNLSKRTAVYATYARVNNSGNSVNYGIGGRVSNLQDGSSSGYDFGLRHSF